MALVETVEVRMARQEERIAASEKAIIIAVSSIDKRLESMNEFRETLREQASKFPTRAELWSFVSTAMFLTVAIITMIQKYFKP